MQTSRAWRNYQFLAGMLLGITYIAYGITKILGGQFDFGGQWSIDSRTVHGTELVWAFFGWSPVYGRFIGAGELGVGLLLLFQRTRLLGALGLFPIALNITVMDFCFGFPAVKYVALTHSILCGFLIYGERNRLFPMLLLPGSDGSISRSVKIAGLVISALIGTVMLNAVLESTSPGPEASARQRCVDKGFRSDLLRTTNWRATGHSAILREGYVEFEVDGSTPAQTLRATVRRASGFVPWKAVDCVEIAGSLKN